MSGYIFRIFLFFLVCTKILIANEGSSSSELASIEPEASVLICGCVHAVTGDFLFQLEKAQTQGQKLRILQDGRHRYYSEFVPASKPGITQGDRRVTEYNPSTRSVRTWHECYNSKGKVVRVHPKQINGQEVKSHHYPKIGSEIK